MGNQAQTYIQKVGMARRASLTRAEKKPTATEEHAISELQAMGIKFSADGDAHELGADAQYGLDAAGPQTAPLMARCAPMCAEAAAGSNSSRRATVLAARPSAGVREAPGAAR